MNETIIAKLIVKEDKYASVHREGHLGNGRAVVDDAECEENGIIQYFWINLK